jgi:large subunit ribosomal protein L21
MYAVIKTGGKQYKVCEGDILKVEKIVIDEGATIDLDALMTGENESISPNGKVNAVVKSHGRREKIHILKFRRRKHSMKRMGHRQSYTELEITKINAA